MSLLQFHVLFYMCLSSRDLFTFLVRVIHVYSYFCIIHTSDIYVVSKVLIYNRLPIKSQVIISSNFVVNLLKSAEM
jgi:hypothetical protein